MANATRTLFRIVIGSGLVAILIALLLLSRTPSVGIPAPPTATQVRAARDTVALLRDHAGKPDPAEIELGWTTIDAGAGMLGHMIGVERMTAARDGDALAIRASVPMRLGFWANAEARLGTDAGGIPIISGRLGRIPVPSWLAAALIASGRHILGLRGIDIPEPAAIVKAVKTGDGGVATTIAIPAGSQLYAALNRARLVSVDSAAVARTYCRLSEAQRAAPATDFAAQVNRVFAPNNSAEDNRAALVALAMFTVTRKVANIAGETDPAVRRCTIAPQPLILQGRADLAKHWSMSAALAAAYGADVSQAMGMWKEVSDSGSGGSGFSFVDLAADRSGIAYGRRAADPALAMQEAARLRSARGEDLLPLNALKLREGMTETQFAQRYTSIDDPRYAAAVAQIDSVLARR